MTDLARSSLAILEAAEAELAEASSIERTMQKVGAHVLDQLNAALGREAALREENERLRRVLGSYDELAAALAREAVLREALQTAQHWHEQLDYDEALNVIDEALRRAALSSPASGEEGA